MNRNVILVVISSLLSGLLAALLTVAFYQHQDVRKAKLDTLRRITGYRWCIMGKGRGSQYVRDQFSAAMNESVVVFNDSSDVVTALQIYNDHVGSGSSDKLIDDVINIIKAMCNDLDLKSPLNDTLLKKAFCLVEDILPNKP